MIGMRSEIFDFLKGFKKQCKCRFDISYIIGIVAKQEESLGEPKGAT